MYISVIKNIFSKDENQCHKYIKGIFEGNSNVLYQRLKNLILVTSDLEYSNVLYSDDISGIVNSWTLGSAMEFSARINSASRNGVPISYNLKSFLDEKFNKCGFYSDFEYKLEGRIEIKNKGVMAYSTLVNGVLKIKDINLFRNTIRFGIPGRFKAYGFGMLNVFKEEIPSHLFFG